MKAFKFNLREARSRETTNCFKNGSRLLSTRISGRNSPSITHRVCLKNFVAYNSLNWGTHKVGTL